MHRIPARGIARRLSRRRTSPLLVAHVRKSARKHPAAATIRWQQPQAPVLRRPRQTLCAAVGAQLSLAPRTLPSLPTQLWARLALAISSCDSHHLRPKFSGAGRGETPRRDRRLYRLTPGPSGQPQKRCQEPFPVAEKKVPGALSVYQNTSSRVLGKRCQEPFLDCSTVGLHIDAWGNEAWDDHCGSPLAMWSTTY